MTYAVPEEEICINVRTRAVCDVTPIRSSSCSKTTGVGIRLARYKCVNNASGQEFESTCIEACCCEKSAGECIERKFEPQRYFELNMMFIV